MFDRNVAAIWGYESGTQTLEGSNADDVVFAYVNGQGIRAMGKVYDGRVAEGKGIFIDKYGNQRPDEYHLAVEWEIKLPKENALSSGEVAAMGYNLPVRVAFGKLHKGHTAMKIEKHIRETNIKNNS